MNAKTLAAYNEIKRAVKTGQSRIAPVTFSPFYGRGATSAAFRIAKREGLIVVAYISCVGTPVYCGPEQAEQLKILETTGATRH